MKKTYFVVSDVHSHYTILKETLKENGWKDNCSRHILILCGDAFDRGRETVELFEFLKNLAKENRLIYIKGNHEELLNLCCNDIEMGYIPMLCHFHNGTVRTICDVCSMTEGEIYNLDNAYFDHDMSKVIAEMMSPYLKFINETCVDYYEIDDKIFVHGWIPTRINAEKSYVYDPNWREGNWKNSRWSNGMLAWKQGAFEKDKTIICGHWDAWWGHEHIDDAKEENHEPFVKEGIICLDSCVVRSKKLNIYKFEK